MIQFLFLTLLVFAGCSPQPEARRHNGIAMTIEYNIIVENQYSAHMVDTIIQETFLEVNAIHNKWNPSSELSRLNQGKGGTYAISPKLENLLLLTDRVVQVTEGRFDPTIEPLQRLYKNGIPSQEQVDQVIVGWDKIHLSPGQIEKQNGLELDLGGIAKGYAVDLLVDNLNAAGLKNVFVEWGGEIRATGRHPSGRTWNISITKLDDKENSITTLGLTNQAAATSGDYLQFWKVGDERFFHIYDPVTKRPLKQGVIASATVVADTCAFADGLATAAMMFETEAEAIAWLERVRKQYPEVQYWLQTR